MTGTDDKQWTVLENLLDAGPQPKGGLMREHKVTPEFINALKDGGLIMHLTGAPGVLAITADGAARVKHRRRGQSEPFYGSNPDRWSGRETFKPNGPRRH